MTLLPLIQRELRLRARQRGSYWLRFAVGMAAILICLPQLLSDQPGMGRFGNTGNSVFHGLTWTAFVLCCAACLLTSDVISSERREGTLGLLFLTRVRWPDVVLGKFVSSGFVGMGGLVALLPILLIPILAGGVSGAEAFRTGLVLLHTLFLCLAIGIYSSAHSEDRGHGTRLTISWWAAVFLAPLLGFFAGLMLLGHDKPTIAVLSPICTMILAGKRNFSPSYFFVSLGLVQLMGWLFLLGSRTPLKQAVREENPKDHGQDFSHIQGLPAALYKKWELSDPSVFKPRVARDLWKKSIPAETAAAWVARRHNKVTAIFWAASVLGLLYNFSNRLFFSFMGVGGPNLLWAFGRWTPYVAFSGTSAVLFAWGASRGLFAARKNGELELLFTTPLGARRLVTEYWAVIRQALRWPVVVLALSVLLPIASILLMQAGFYQRANSWAFHYALNSLLSIVSTILGVGAVCRVGLWFGMKAATQGRAILWTVLLVKAPPYLLSLFWSAISIVNGLQATRDFFYLWIVPHFVTISYYLWLIRASRQDLAQLVSVGESDNSLLNWMIARARRDVEGGVLKLRDWHTS